MSIHKTGEETLKAKVPEASDTTSRKLNWLDFVWLVVLVAWATSFIYGAYLYADMRERMYRFSIQFDALWCIWGTDDPKKLTSEDCTLQHMKRFGADAIMNYVDDDGERMSPEAVERLWADRAARESLQEPKP